MILLTCKTAVGLFSRLERVNKPHKKPLVIFCMTTLLIRIDPDNFLGQHGKIMFSINTTFTPRMLAFPFPAFTLQLSAAQVPRSSQASFPPNRIPASSTAVKIVGVLHASCCNSEQNVTQASDSLSPQLGCNCLQNFARLLPGGHFLLSKLCLHPLPIKLVMARCPPWVPVHHGCSESRAFPYVFLNQDGHTLK